MTWRSEWKPRQENFFKKSLRAFSSWNQRWEGEGSEEDALEWRGFRDGVNLRLGAMMQTERGRERETSRKAPKQFNIWI